MLTVTILTMAMCGYIAELPEGHCEETASWEYQATSLAEAEKDWQRCMTRRQIFIEKFDDPMVLVECDQFKQKKLEL